jgi:hypothetical protein
VQWAKTGTYALVKTRSANLRVYCAGGILPPGVFVGRMVIGIGKIVTYEQGRDWRVSDALPIPTEWLKLMRPVFRYFDKHVADVREWVPPEILEMYRTGKRPS